MRGWILVGSATRERHGINVLQINASSNFKFIRHQGSGVATPSTTLYAHQLPPEKVWCSSCRLVVQLLSEGISDKAL